MEAADLIGATGGCLCGAVRYRLSAKPSDAGYCHCRMCQQTAGGPVMAFTTVPLSDFVVTDGEPQRRRSSAFGERWFCGDCGSPSVTTKSLRGTVAKAMTGPPAVCWHMRQWQYPASDGLADRR